LTDIAAAICGGIGLAASGNINPTGQFPSMFEPVHGSAPDIAGKNLADPTATVMSISMMLDHLKLHDAARDVENAVATDLSTRGTTKRSTTEVGSALAALVK
jgi:3-isopropylmalate dehydrogenase